MPSLAHFLGIYWNWWDINGQWHGWDVANGGFDDIGRCLKRTSVFQWNSIPFFCATVPHCFRWISLIPLQMLPYPFLDQCKTASFSTSQHQFKLSSWLSGNSQGRHCLQTTFGNSSKGLWPPQHHWIILSFPSPFCGTAHHCTLLHQSKNSLPSHPSLPFPRPMQNCLFQHKSAQIQAVTLTFSKFTGVGTVCIRLLEIKPRVSDPHNTTGLFYGPPWPPSPFCGTVFPPIRLESFLDECKTASFSTSNCQSLHHIAPVGTKTRTVFHGLPSHPSLIFSWPMQNCLFQHKSALCCRLLQAFPSQAAET